MSGRLLDAALERARRNVEAGEWLDAPTEVAEAAFVERVHPRDRLGRWRDVWAGLPPRRVTSDELFHATLGERLPEEQRRAVVGYTSGSRDLSVADREVLAAVVAAHPLPGAIALTRKVATHELDRLSVGDVVTEDRFVSASAGYSGIGTGASDHGTLRLDVPAGVPAYANPWNYSESEVILAPGTRYRVDSVEAFDGRPQVRATVLRDAASDSPGRPPRLAGLREADAGEFANLLAQAHDGPHGLWLTAHPAEELRHDGARAFVANGGHTGGALIPTPDGHLEAGSLFNRRDLGAPAGAGGDMLDRLAAEGADRLTAIGPVLRAAYEAHGWHVAETYQWNDELAPEGWDYGADGRPPVYGMAR